MVEREIKLKKWNKISHLAASDYNKFIYTKTRALNGSLLTKHSHLPLAARQAV